MQQPAYLFRRSDDALLFEFESVSIQRNIRKVVEYARLALPEEVFNLGLFDVTDAGDYDDLSVSNNQDFEKIMATVIQTLPFFFAKRPKAQVFFSGSTASRTRLYRIVLTKVLPEAAKTYIVRGVKAGRTEPFVPGRNYDGFLIRLKQQPTFSKLVP